MPARRHGREQGNAAHMVGRDRREGAAFLREGKSKYFCKGGCSYFLRRKRKKINKPQPQPFCLKPPGCGAKRAVPGRAARRHVPAPGRPGAAWPWGESSFILTDKRAKRPPHHPIAREASASLEGVFQGKPSTGLFPPGGKMSRVAPREVGALWGKSPLWHPTLRLVAPRRDRSAPRLFYELRGAWVAELGRGNGAPRDPTTTLHTPGPQGQPPTSGFPLLPQDSKARKRM